MISTAAVTDYIPIRVYLAQWLSKIRVDLVVRVTLVQRL
eukprot:COSAG01_NODE_43377_length_430_cov_1.072508_1_plen_38_part_01